ncbi:hypothetical protein EB001_09005 [bacterium]|nr:hypothetical protein [bacterium]
MTPQEKAQELVDKFSNVEIYISIEPTDIECQIKHTQCDAAIQCALITVDELLEDKVEIDGMRVINDSYWMEVKQELLNLKNK